MYPCTTSTRGVSLLLLHNRTIVVGDVADNKNIRIKKTFSTFVVFLCVLDGISCFSFT